MFDVRLPDDNYNQFWYTYTVVEKVMEQKSTPKRIQEPQHLYIRGNCTYCKSDVWSDQKCCKNCGASEAHNSNRSYIKRDK